MKSLYTKEEQQGITSYISPSICYKWLNRQTTNTIPTTVKPPPWVYKQVAVLMEVTHSVFHKLAQSLAKTSLYFEINTGRSNITGPQTVITFYLGV